MGLFDDMLLGGAGLAFVEHEHTKHNRQRFEQQAYLQQQQAIQQQQQQQGYRGPQQQWGPPPSQQGGAYYQSRDMYGAGPQQQQCAFCPNCGFNLQQGGAQQGQVGSSKN
jgi:hypothetical protein